MIIDAHHHFWKYNAADYSWIDDSMQRLQRDFLPEDLREEFSPVSVEGVVSVQARQSLSETSWLLELAKSHDFIRGVVGWVDLCGDQVRRQLESFASSPKFAAVRHVVQDEPDDCFILRNDFNEGVGQLKEFDLAYDILIFAKHLPPTIEFVDRHPQQVFVLDHIGKPEIAKNSYEPWRTHLLELAKRPNVYCKISGMVTEADPSQWTSSQLNAYWEIALEAFGPERLMFGSDWPVCLVGCEYSRWFETIRGFAAALSPAEQEALFGKTAITAYKLN